MDVELTPVEAEVQRIQGRTIGPTVEERPVRQMGDSELRDLLFRLIRDGEGSRRKNWYRRQAEKVRKELSRRGNGCESEA